MAKKEDQSSDFIGKQWQWDQTIFNFEKNTSNSNDIKKRLCSLKVFQFQGRVVECILQKICGFGGRLITKYRQKVRGRPITSPTNNFNRAMGNVGLVLIWEYFISAERGQQTKLSQMSVSWWNKVSWDHDRDVSK